MRKQCHNYSETDPTPGILEPVSKTNLYKDPNDESTTWMDYVFRR